MRKARAARFVAWAEPIAQVDGALRLVEAVIPADVSRSARFAEFVTELQRNPVFRVFAERDEARAWLST